MKYSISRRELRDVAVHFSLLCFLLFAGCRADEGDPATAYISSSNERPAISDTAAVHLLDGDIGQTVYVPVYSHIYHQDGTRELNLTATLSIRNTDPEHTITVTAVRYFDSSGSLVRSYLDQPLVLQPLASKSYVVEERDKAGGVGANFIVQCQAGTIVSTPIIEAVMISTASTQGLSFVTRGEVVRPLDDEFNPEHQP